MKIIISAIAIAVVLAGYVFYRQDSSIRILEQEINQIKTQNIGTPVYIGQKEDNGNEYEKSPPEIVSRVGGNIKEISGRDIKFSIKIIGTKVFDEFQGEKIAEVTRATTFKERTLEYSATKKVYSVKGEREIKFSDVKVGDVVEIISTDDATGEVFTAGEVVVIKRQ